MARGTHSPGGFSSAGKEVVVYRTDVADGQRVELPGVAELVRIGREDLGAAGRDPDSWVDRETEDQLRRGRAERTLEVMHWGWGRWIAWCGATGRRHLGAHPNSVRQYIKDHWHMRDPDGNMPGRDDQPYAPKTVRLAIDVISMVHQRLGFRSPLEDPKVNDQWQAYKNDFEAADYHTHEPDPMTYGMSLALARYYDLGTVQGLRNAAMFRLQFDTGARFSEILNLTGARLTWIGEHRVDIRFERTKTHKSRTVTVQTPSLATVLDRIDPDSYERRRGESDVEVVERLFQRGADEPDEAFFLRVFPDYDVDPVRLLRLYVRARVSAGWNGKGPLWVQVRPYPRARKDFAETGILAGRFTNEPLTREGYEMAFIYGRDHSGINIDPVTGNKLRISTHSMRAGHVTEGVNAGVPLEIIASRTGHSSTAINVYYRGGRQTDDRNSGVVIRVAHEQRSGRRPGLPEAPIYEDALAREDPVRKKKRGKNRGKKKKGKG